MENVEQYIQKVEEILKESDKQFEEVGSPLSISKVLKESIQQIIDSYRQLYKDYDNELDENLKMSEWLVEKQHRIEELENKLKES